MQFNYNMITRLFKKIKKRLLIYLIVNTAYVFEPCLYINIYTYVYFQKFDF